MLAPLAHSCGVDEEESLSAPLIKNIDGVPSGAGQLADNRARIAQDRIDQRRFSGVRATDDGERSGGILNFGFWILDFRFGKKAINNFQKIGNTATVSCAYRNGIVETEPREISVQIFVFLVIDLVYNKHDGAFRLPQKFRQLLIDWIQARLRGADE